MINHSTKKIIKVNPFLIKTYSTPPNWWWFRAIDKRIKNSYVKNYLENIALGKMYYGGNWDLKSIPFHKTHWYLRVNNLKQNIHHFENSIWYQSIMAEINSKGYYFHKKIKIKSKHETITFLKKYVIELIESLKNKQFIQEDVNDIPKILIGRNGELIKSGHGCHRLAIIKSYQIKCEFPVQIIGIHKKFKLDNIDNVYKYVTSNYSLS